MNQLDLAIGSTQTEAHKLARRSDPVTSKMAAHELVESGALNRQQEAVLEALRKHDGFTSDELAHAAGLDRHMVARRLPELSARGRVKQDGRRVSALSGRMAMVWRAC